MFKLLRWLIVIIGFCAIGVDSIHAANSNSTFTTRNGVMTVQFPAPLTAAETKDNTIALLSDMALLKSATKALDNLTLPDNSYVAQISYFDDTFKLDSKLVDSSNNLDIEKFIEATGYPSLFKRADVARIGSLLVQTAKFESKTVKGKVIIAKISNRFVLLIAVVPLATTDGWEQGTDLILSGIRFNAPTTQAASTFTAKDGLFSVKVPAGLTAQEYRPNIILVYTSDLAKLGADELIKSRALNGGEYVAQIIYYDANNPPPNVFTLTDNPVSIISALMKSNSGDTKFASVQTKTIGALTVASVTYTTNVVQGALYVTKISGKVVLILVGVAPTEPDGWQANDEVLLSSLKFNTEAIVSTPVATVAPTQRATMVPTGAATAAATENATISAGSVSDTATLEATPQLAGGRLSTLDGKYSLLIPSGWYTVSYATNTVGFSVYISTSGALMENIFASTKIVSAFKTLQRFYYIGSYPTKASLPRDFTFNGDVHDFLDQVLKTEATTNWSTPQTRAIGSSMLLYVFSTGTNDGNVYVRAVMVRDNVPFFISGIAKDGEGDALITDVANEIETIIIN